MTKINELRDITSSIVATMHDMLAQDFYFSWHIGFEEMVESSELKVVYYSLLIKYYYLLQRTNVISLNSLTFREGFHANQQ